MSYKPPPLIPNDVFFEQVVACLKDHKKVTIFVKGRSMLPFIRNGDKVLLEPICPSSFKAGTIVLAKTSIGFVLHRILTIREDVVVLAGDGNIKQVEHTLRDQVFASVNIVFRGKSKWNIQSLRFRAAWRIWCLVRQFLRYLFEIKQLTKLEDSKHEIKK